MNPEQKEILDAAFIKVTENLAFMFADPITKEDLPELDQEYIQAVMFYSGDYNGELVLFLPMEMCLDLAANILGKDTNEALKMVKATDAAKELLNISCGLILTSVYGDKALFDLTCPQASMISNEMMYEESDNGEILYYAVDDWFVMMRWTPL